jgi:hypothetical protein
LLLIPNEIKEWGIKLKKKTKKNNDQILYWKKSNKDETEKTFQLYKLIEIKKIIIKRILIKFEETPS